MPDREPIILGYGARRRRKWRRLWVSIQIALSVIVALAVIRALRSPYTTTGTLTLMPATPTTTADVTQGLFLLLRSQDITSEVFSCPATQPTKWEFDEADASQPREETRK
jgi:hypothetical protein